MQRVYQSERPRSPAKLRLRTPLVIVSQRQGSASERCAHKPIADCCQAKTIQHIELFTQLRPLLLSAHDHV